MAGMLRRADQQATEGLRGLLHERHATVRAPQEDVEEVTARMMRFYVARERGLFAEMMQSWLHDPVLRAMRA